MQTITITNRKGGVAKTTTCQQIGAGLHRLGYRVLFIDLDSQSNLTETTGAEQNRNNIVEVLKKKVSAADAIQQTEQGDIISAVPELANLGSIKSNTLKAILEPLQSEYDFCLIDTPSQLGEVTVNALTASDGVIIPTTPEHSSLEGVVKVSNVIKTVQQKTNPDLKLLGLLLVKYGNRSNIEKAMKENAKELAESLGTKVFDTVIRRNTSIPEASFFGQDIFAYSIRSNGAKDYARLISEVLKSL